MSSLFSSSSSMPSLDLSKSNDSMLLSSASPSPASLTTPLPPSPPASPDSPAFLFANLFVPRGSSKEYSFPSDGDAGGGGSTWDSDEHERRVDEVDFQLRIEDRNMMDELMSIKASRAACEMAAEVVGIIVPALPKKSGYDLKTRYREAAQQQQKKVVAAGLFLWSNLAPSPLIALIVTVILLERLVASHPRMGEVITRDAPLRIAFAGFLLALKITSDTSHLNKSFVHYTPWKLHDLNAMEKQLLEFLGFDLWISSEEILHRASAFWISHKTPPTSTANSSGSSDDVDDPLPSLLGNLFLMQPRFGVDEKSWRGGLVRGSGESGSRISSAGEEEESTVWRRGRLERREEMDQYGREK